MLNFSRRINRFTYFIGILLSVVGVLLVDVVQALIEVANDDFLGKNSLVDTFQGIFILAGISIALIYLLCLTRQRANDISWHPLLITLLAFWNPISLLLLIIPGSNNVNKFGTPSKTGVHIKS